MKKLLKESKSAIKSIEAKANGAKRHKVSKCTRDKINSAYDIAQNRIRHNSQIYNASMESADDYVLDS